MGCPERFARDSLYMLPQLEENVNSKNPNWDIAFFILQSKMKLFFLSNCPIEETKGFNLVTINPKIALLFFNKG